jgi:hypothetical protein
MRVSRLAIPLLLGVWALAPLRSDAAIFVVDSIGNGADGDLSDGACRDAAGACTLRAAIQEANLTVAADRIEFAIPGAGPHVIPTIPLTLPAITRDLVIDGYTQPGSSANTLLSGTDAQIGIEIEGTFGDGIQVLGGRVAVKGLGIRGYTNGVLFDSLVSSVAGSMVLGCRIEGTQSGVLLTADGVRVGSVGIGDRNLISDNQAGITISNGSHFVVNNLIGVDAIGSAPLGNTSGISVEGGSFHAITDNVISGNVYGVIIASFSNDNTLVRNRIGTSADGRTAVPNLRGIEVQSQRNHIGLPSPGRVDANVISGNDVVGVSLSGGGNFVQGNEFGTDGGAAGAFGNFRAIEIGSSDNVIGAPATGFVNDAGNVIAHSVLDGITVLRLLGGVPQTANNSLRGNVLYGNAGFDIDLNGDGNLNLDLGDVDTGPNGLQNPPTLDAVSVSAGNLVFDGKLDTLPGNYTLDFYSSSTCDTGTDTGAARFHLGSFPVGVASGPIDFNAALSAIAIGHAFTAMATDANGNSSELGPCLDALIAGGADLSVLASLDPAFAVVAPGEVVQIEVTVANAGPATATDVPVVVAHPPGFEDWSSTGDGSYDETSGVWSVGTLVSGANATRVFDATIADGAAGLQTVVAESLQGLSQPDPELSGNQSSVTFDVQSGAHLAITQTAPASALPGDAFSIDVSVTNEGPEDAAGVTIRGRLAAGLELDVASAPAEIEYNPTTGNWSLPLGDLADGESTSVVLPVRVAAATPIGTGLDHTISAYSAGVDPAPTLSAATIPVGVEANLHLSGIASGGNGVWYVYLWNEDRSNLPLDSLSVLVEVNGCGRPITVEGADDCIAGPCPFQCAVPVFFANDGSATITLLGSEFGEPSFRVDLKPDPAQPYIERDDSDNGGTFVALICGLFGLEAPLFLALLILFRGRAGRLAVRRLFPGTAVIVALAIGSSARAESLTFEVDTAASHATIALSGSLGAPEAVEVSLSGAAATEIVLGYDALFGLTPESLQITGATLALSDATILRASAPIFDLAFTADGVGASLFAPTALGFPVGPGLSLFDLSDATLVFDTGFVTTTGSFFGASVAQSIDLSTVPFTSPFANGAVAQVRLLDVGEAQATVRLSLPFSAPLHLSVGDETVTLTLAGTLVANAIATVPEPAAALLLAPALLVLAALRSQMWRSSSSQRSRGPRKRAGESGERSSAR